MTPTDPIRDEAVKVLAEVLAIVQPPDPEWVAGIADPPSVPSANWPGWATALLDASPTLARRLALGTAWDAALATMPDDAADRLRREEQSIMLRATRALAAKLGSGK